MNGKGDKNRTQNFTEYRNNMDAIFRKKTSAKWLNEDKEFNEFVIYDADGWKDVDQQYFNNVEISREEFTRRFIKSTIGPKPSSDEKKS